MAFWNYIHRSRAPGTWIVNEVYFVCMNIQACGPDVNHIENLWDSVYNVDSDII